MRSILLPARRRSLRLPLWAFLFLGILTPSILGSSCLQAQVSAGARSAIWAAPAVGLAAGGLLAGVDVSLYDAPRLYQLRFTAQSTGGSGDLTEIAVMYGSGGVTDFFNGARQWDGGHWWSAAAGPALVNATHVSPMRDATTLGIAGELKMISRRPPHVSLTLLGNLNSETPFLGLSLGWAFGRMPWSQPSAPPRRRPGPFY
ncbi:MAG TPA: hypothetical protein VF461_03640 [Gemmatimonadaceae bacterium]